MKYLLDLNALIALGDPNHVHHNAIQNWFIAEGHKNWGVCPLTEAGFIRITANPRFCAVPRTVDLAIAILQSYAGHPGYCYWPIMEMDKWALLTAPFAARIVGHQQVTDAYLLGLAIKYEGVLVSFDKALLHLAGPEYLKNLRVLE
ncbi:MAG: VapC toxin family PIN domain ribonuclease [Terracidiphilus sp.]|nr:VapC toxin family PIN domain ribonuclease [Terracidiphilus sp.]